MLHCLVKSFAQFQDPSCFSIIKKKDYGQFNLTQNDIGPMLHLMDAL
jgi:hypothetical protein